MKVEGGTLAEPRVLKAEGPAVTKLQCCVSSILRDQEETIPTLFSWGSRTNCGVILLTMGLEEVKLHRDARSSETGRTDEKKRPSIHVGGIEYPTLLGSALTWL